MVIVAESIENNVVVSATRTYPKDPADYTVDEKSESDNTYQTTVCLKTVAPV